MKRRPYVWVSVAAVVALLALVGFVTESEIDGDSLVLLTVAGLAAWVVLAAAGGLAWTGGRATNGDVAWRTTAADVLAGCFVAVATFFACVGIGGVFWVLANDAYSESPASSHVVVGAVFVAVAVLAAIASVIAISTSPDPRLWLALAVSALAAVALPTYYTFDVRADDLRVAFAVLALVSLFAYASEVLRASRRLTRTPPTRLRGR
ncbi:MAG: hypothetical protein M3M94_00375 [Actinomycetota bacterium]|nr:hypothetical protein [Actinomycetota bacterium]